MILKSTVIQYFNYAETDPPHGPKGNYNAVQIMGELANHQESAPPPSVSGHAQLHPFASRPITVRSARAAPGATQEEVVSHFEGRGWRAGRDARMAGSDWLLSRFPGSPGVSPPPPLTPGA